MSCFLLLESGGKLLQQSDSALLIDGCVDPPPVVDVIVPDVVGQPFPTGVGMLTAVELALGGIIDEHNFAPPGTILAQSPAAGASVAPGSTVALTRSLGLELVTVPDLKMDTLSEAALELTSVGLVFGSIDFTDEPVGRLGTIVSQTPLPGSRIPPGSRVSVVATALFKPFDFNRTVISQYANSPTLLQLIADMDEYIDPRVNLTNFYRYVWNVDTAVGFGLDVWGRIVGVSRLLQIPGSDPIVGFDNPSVPKDWFPMSEGRFAIEGEVTTAYELPDDAYRVLILTKALANIITTTAPALNQLLRNMFPGRGRAFVRDLGNMAMQFVFNFRLSTVEYAILTQSGVLPHPAGVFYSVVVVAGGLFGFQGYTGARPFNYGVFNSRPP